MTGIRMTDNVWRFRDADGGVHAVGYDRHSEVVAIDGRPFTVQQAIGYAEAILMFAGAADRTPGAGDAA